MHFPYLKFMVHVSFPWGKWGGGDPHMKGVGMLVVSLRGINFGFWSHLGCSGQTPSYLAVKVSFRVAREKYILSVF